MHSHIFKDIYKVFIATTAATGTWVVTVW